MFLHSGRNAKKPLVARLMLIQLTKVSVTLACSAFNFVAFAQRMQGPPPGTLNQPSPQQQQPLPLQPGTPPGSLQRNRAPNGYNSPPPPQLQSGSPYARRKPADRESYAIRGLKTFYGQVDSGGGLLNTERCDPSSGSCDKPIQESKYNLMVSALIGWGPLRTDDFLFNLQYKYTQNYQTDAGRVDVFFKKWFAKPTAETFIFPTRDMLRTNEFATDFRYVNTSFQAGLFTRFAISRVGSSTFGEELEQADTVSKTENVVPYFAYKYSRLYRGQLSMPFRTEINSADDPRLNNATYSLSSQGRGRLFSLKLNNGFYIPQIDSIAYFDVYRMDYKYASIQNDRTRYGLATSFDFPVYWDIRATPKLIYYQENFIVERVRIDGFKTGGAGGDNVNALPTLKKRTDKILKFGIYAYWDINRSNRADFEFSMLSSNSTISEYNIKQMLIVFGYSYSYQATTTVNKRVNRFADDSYAEEF